MDPPIGIGGQQAAIQRTLQYESANAEHGLRTGFRPTCGRAAGSHDGWRRYGEQAVGMRSDRRVAVVQQAGKRDARMQGVAGRRREVAGFRPTTLVKSTQRLGASGR
jgi:hypothetical protein